MMKVAMLLKLLMLEMKNDMKMTEDWSLFDSVEFVVSYCYEHRYYWADQSSKTIIANILQSKQRRSKMN